MLGISEGCVLNRYIMYLHLHIKTSILFIFIHINTSTIQNYIKLLLWSGDTYDLTNVYFSFCCMKDVTETINDILDDFTEEKYTFIKSY